MRRYTKGELETKLRRAGFRPIVSRYFDLLGVPPWWIKYRLLKSATMEPGAVRFYDRVHCSAARRVESLIHPPIGKNVIVIAEKNSRQRTCKQQTAGSSVRNVNPVLGIGC